MTLDHVGFGVEIETCVKPKRNQNWSNSRHYTNFAKVLESEHGLSAIGNESGSKYPADYKRWWITSDASIQAGGGYFGMESVSPVMQSNRYWENDMKSFWKALRAMFDIKKTVTAGTHIHLAPTGRDFSLREAKTIAFACCYYERYIISCLPEDRRDSSYCTRNSQKASKMGKLYNTMTSRDLIQIARDINGVNDEEDLITYMQGGTNKEVRYCLWNFRKLHHGKEGQRTIEFRGGRHLRGPARAVSWITFAQVFVLMALKENLIDKPGTLAVPSNTTAIEVQEFWEKVRRYAERYSMEANLPIHFKMMSEKMSWNQITYTSDSDSDLSGDESEIDVGPNRSSEPMSLTLVGNRYYFCGPACNSWNHKPWTKEQSESDMYVVFGQNGSWYRHYHKAGGDCWTLRSGIKNEYPGLEALMTKNKLFGCPDSLSLGPNGYYFAKWPEWVGWNLPDAITNYVGDMMAVERMFLGKDGSYLAVMKNGQSKWNLKGHYRGLAEQVKKWSPDDRPKALALNLEMDDCWCAATENGDVRVLQGSAFKRIIFKRWSAINLGSKWEV